MDPHRICTSVCAVVVCLLGATRLSSGDNCKCPAIPPKELTVRKDGCFNSTFRYECITGYTRKPGTSGLIRCQEKNGVLQWTESLFKCITDPNYQPPPTTTAANSEYRPHPTISMDKCKCPAIPPKELTVRKDGCFQINSTYRYECTTGYMRKPGTSGLIRCQEKNGVIQWTESLLKCITDPNYQPPPTTTAAPPGPSSTLQSVRTSTSEPSVSPNTERRALGPSSTLQSVRTSTSEPSASPNTERRALGGGRRTVCISLIGVILFFMVCGIIFFLHRQRNKPIPPRDPEELEAMKC
ncbi:interleukin-2 receptor subunit alpha-like isoform X6 [Xiphophorus hellerii]|uniref:interleukin-2 receptor subunit alpha-like isoform X6 n=1 Tax=Xiphophorus hellerii TaxID=8084 RepID=UPI0013B3A425|nr:interleukin-2 receptor subunit alpha-like isoform X6 [Xiphophorus hellerii]